MNKNSTPTGKGLIVNLSSTSRKIAVAAVAILFSLLSSISTVSAQNTDLSNADGMAGATVINKQSLNGNSVKLNVDNVKPGPYIIKINGANGTLIPEKMMVSNYR